MAKEEAGIAVCTSGTSLVDIANFCQVLSIPRVTVKGVFFDRKNAVVDQIKKIAFSEGIPTACVPWNSYDPSKAQNPSAYREWSEGYHRNFVMPALEKFGDLDFVVLARYKNIVYGLDSPFLNLHQSPPRADGLMIEGNGFYKGFCSPKEPLVQAKRVINRDKTGGGMTHAADPSVPLDEGCRATFFTYSSDDAPWHMTNHIRTDELVKLGTSDPLIAYLIRENESYLPTFLGETLRLFGLGHLSWRNSRTILYKGEKLSRPLDITLAVVKKINTGILITERISDIL